MRAIPSVSRMSVLSSENSSPLHETLHLFHGVALQRDRSNCYSYCPLKLGENENRKHTLFSLRTQTTEGVIAITTGIHFLCSFNYASCLGSEITSAAWKHLLSYAHLSGGTYTLKSWDWQNLPVGCYKAWRHHPWSFRLPQRNVRSSSISVMSDDRNGHGQQQTPTDLAWRTG